MHISNLNIRKPRFESYRIEANELNSSNENLSFNKLNIFIGENNSGKSRLLRSIIIDYNYHTYQDKNNYSDIIKGQLHYVYDLLTNSNIRNELLQNISLASLLNISISSLSYKISQNITHIDNLIEYVELLRELSKSVLTTMNSVCLSDDNFKYANLVNNEIDNVIHKIECIHQEIKVEARYIPILRGLKPLHYEGNLHQWSYNNILKARIMHEYFTDNSGYNLPENFIFTGQDMYELVKKRLLGNKKDREFITEYENYLSENFFNGELVSILPHDDTKILYIKIGDNEERAIHDLGDGIQSIVIITYELFSNRFKNMMFFIEEPEMFLHPKYQRQLVETFLKKEFEKFQFFITTHSNHFIDLINEYRDINIFTITSSNEGKLNRFKIEKVSDDDYKPYSVLGIRNSSVLLSNCTIWVEGLSDKIYIKKYLDTYQIRKLNKVIYKEDVHYNFIEYGGNNILHWNFIDKKNYNFNYKSLAKRVFIILDRDSPKEGSEKDKRQKKFKKEYGQNCYILNCLEIENTISLEILKKVVSEFQGKNGVPVKLSPKIKSDIEYQFIGMGKFLEENMIEGNKKFTNSSSTINNKIDFALKTVEYIEKYDDLSDEAKKLATQVFNFIKENNG